MPAVCVLLLAAAERRRFDHASRGINLQRTARLVAISRRLQCKKSVRGKLNDRSRMRANTLQSANIPASCDIRTEYQMGWILRSQRTPRAARWSVWRAAVLLTGSAVLFSTSARGAGE